MYPSVHFTGKLTLMAALATRELPVPEHIDIFMLRREMPPSDKSALECVMEVDEERMRLEKEAEILATRDDNGMCGYCSNVLTLSQTSTSF